MRTIRPKRLHLALGRASDAYPPEGEGGGDSAIYADATVDMPEDARLSVDGNVVQ